MILDKLIRAYTENKFLDVSQITTKQHIPLINYSDKLTRFTDLPMLSDNYYNYKQALLQLYPYAKRQSLLLAISYGDSDFVNKLDNLAKNEIVTIEEIEDDLLSNYAKSKDRCLKMALDYQHFNFIDQLTKVALDEEDYEFVNELIIKSF